MSAGEGASGVPYRIELSPDAREHLHGLTARERSMVTETIQAQLVHEPATETRNRKGLRPNALATWELRVGKLRVHYEVQMQTILLYSSARSEPRSVIKCGSPDNLSVSEDD